MRSKGSAFSRSLTAEIAIHTVIIIFVYLPILVFLFPAAIILVGTTIVSSFVPDTSFAAWLTSNSNGPMSIGVFLTLIVAATGISHHLNRIKSKGIRPKSLQGHDGVALERLVQKMWEKIAEGPAPAVRWFPAFDIAGYAALCKGKPELHLSAGLWQKAVSGEKTAEAILAHELAHVRNNDPLRLKILDLFRVGAASILIFATAIGIAVFCFVLMSEATTAFQENGAGAMMFRSLLVVVGTTMLLVVFPLSWFALRRHLGFVHSLMEVRADIDAAHWTGGREAFTQAFATNKNVMRSGHRELLTALISRTISHIPERERLDIIGTPALIITPKTRFFALSIMLALALPLNFGSGLILGGGANHLIALSVAVAFNAALVCMLIIGQSDGPVKLGVWRLATLALVSVLVNAVPRINLEPVSYLIMSWTLGFGGAPADLNTLFDSVSITTIDLSKKVANAVLNIEALAALIIVALSLWALTISTAKQSILPTGIRAALAVLLVTTGSNIAGYDAFRSFELPFVVEIAEWLDELKIGRSILLCLPISLVLAIDIAIIALRSMLPKALA